MLPCALIVLLDQLREQRRGLVVLRLQRFPRRLGLDQLVRDLLQLCVQLPDRLQPGGTRRRLRVLLRRDDGEWPHAAWRQRPEPRLHHWRASRSNDRLLQGRTRIEWTFLQRVANLLLKCVPNLFLQRVEDYLLARVKPDVLD